MIKCSISHICQIMQVYLTKPSNDLNVELRLTWKRSVLCVVTSVMFKGRSHQLFLGPLHSRAPPVLVISLLLIFVPIALGVFLSS